MRKFLSFCLGLFMFPNLVSAQEDYMKIKLSFDEKTVLINLYDNSASRQLAALLPAEFDFRDYAGEEKITEFAKPLSLENAPRGMIAKAGEMFIFAPWGNMGIFYQDHGQTIDKALIPLGHVTKGLEHLAQARKNFTAKLEIIKEDEKQ